MTPAPQMASAPLVRIGDGVVVRIQEEMRRGKVRRSPSQRGRRGWGGVENIFSDVVLTDEAKGTLYDSLTFSGKALLGLKLKKKKLKKKKHQNNPQNLLRVSFSWNIT